MTLSFLRGAAISLMLALGAGALRADEAPVPDPVGQIVTAMRGAEMIAVMRLEGEQYGDALSQQYLGSPGTAGWITQVDAIYDRTLTIDRITEGMRGALQGADTDAILTFLTSQTGTRFAEAELQARRAMLDPQIEAAALASGRQAVAAQSPRALQLGRMMDATDMVSTNTALTLNDLLALFHGLRDGQFPGLDMSDAQILEIVSSQASDLDRTTTDWLHGYLQLAYSSISDADVDAYIAFLETPAGQAFNAATFATFGTISEDINTALGHALAEAAGRKPL
ncbi:MAG: hypothetical protein GC146_12220 [Limimaricola sp.]|uniref:hypothetical protein n=1 Tax=Limimaricola sp. TaxID=2211665 RepID=UPI001DA3CBD0|nr:hypothetical protein [Limimaricola sp.]MBI1417978.1 hypothetical protein [Limimaricola sp.]